MSAPAMQPIQGAVRHLSKEQQMTLRDKAINKVLELLRAGPCTPKEMQAATGVQKDTMNAYKRYMHTTLRTIRPTGEKRDAGQLWELGEDPNLPAKVEKLDPLAAKRDTYPAQQIGIHRHWMDVALFGPATR